MICFKIENLSFRYNHNYILSNINFEINIGENIGILGPNGSGKTTLLRLLDKNLKPSNGNIFLYQKNIQNYKQKDIARHIAFVPQISEYIFPFTVMEIVLMGRAPFLRGLGFENQNDYEVAWKVLELTKINDLKDKPINSLSGGEKQRVLIARALCQEPDIILLDEPNAHLDISHQLEIFSLMRNMNKEKNVTIISVSHDLNLSSIYYDKIVILKDGKIFQCGAPDEVLTKSNIERVFDTEVEIDPDYYSGKPRITILPN